MEIKFWEILPDKIEEVIQSSCKNAIYSILWSCLQQKSEYGSKLSEKGFQSIAADYAEYIAVNLNANAKKAKGLAIYLGSAFPTFGAEGMKCFVEYLKNHNIEMSESDLLRSLVEYSMSDNLEIVTKDFDEILKALFDKTKTSEIVEVEIAKVVHECMEAMKYIAERKFEDFGDNEMLDKLAEACKAAGKPVQIPEVKEILANPPIKRKTISPEDKAMLFKLLDEMVEEQEGDVLVAVLECMYTIGEPSKYITTGQMGEE